MRAGHRRTLPVRAAVSVAKKRTVYTLLGISARCGYIQPISIVGVGCLVARSSESANCNDGLIRDKGVEVEVVVSGGKDCNTALHGRAGQLVAIVVASSILDEIVYGSLVLGKIVDSEAAVEFYFLVRSETVAVKVWRKAPAALENHGAVVCTVLDGLVNIGLSAIQVEYLARHDFHAALACHGISSCYSGDAYAVVVDSSDDSGHMRTVPLCRNDRRSVIVEIIAAVTVLHARYKIGGQIFMFHEHAFINHRNDDFAAARCKLIPNLLYVDIKTFVAGIVIMPLTAEVRIVEGTQPDWQLRRHRNDSLLRLQLPCRFCGRKLRVELHIIKTVKAFPSCPGLILAGIGKNPAQRLYAYPVQHTGKRRSFGLKGLG